MLKAQEEERKNIARELHDHLGQGMAVLLMDLHHLEGDLAAEDPARAQVQKIVRVVQEHEAMVRDMGLLLRPYMLDDLGLVPALKWQAREVSRRTGMKVTVDADDACNQLSEDYRTCIFRVVQETLHNAAHHAKAGSAHITMRQDSSHVRVKVLDDGCGFDTRCTKGMGMLGIEERARNLGGVCRFDSKPGGGATVSILLPRASASDRRDHHEANLSPTGLAAWCRRLASAHQPRLKAARQGS